MTTGGQQLMHKRRRTHGSILGLAILALAGGDVALAAAPKPVPYSPTGSLKIKLGSPAATSRLVVTFAGKLPALKKGEYVAYNTVFTGVPKNGCTSLGADADAGPTRAKRTSATLDPGVGVETPSNTLPRWCSGRWLAQAQLYTPFGKGVNRAFRPRLTFSRANFRIP